MVFTNSVKESIYSLINWIKLHLKTAQHVNKDAIKQQVLAFDRQFIAQAYLKGEGIEIGALNNPLKVPESIKVRYIERMPLKELEKQYPSLNSKEFVKTDIIDDGEFLRSLRDSSVNFVIANHFIEHCENPIKSFENMVRVIKSGGILYLSVPDKRFTFDKNRPVTPIEHVLKDYYEDPKWSKRLHFEEFAMYFDKFELIKYFGKVKDAEDLMKMNYSIHYHVWTQTEILELILLLKKMLNTFETEMILKNIHEVIIILKKN